MTAGGPVPIPGANQAIQMNMQMQINMQMQMNRARMEAQRVQRRKANDMAARVKDGLLKDEISKPMGEAWRATSIPGCLWLPDGEMVFLSEGNQMIGSTRDKNTFRWMTTFTGGLESGPVVGNGLLLFTTSDYRLVALEGQSGKERYHVQLEALKRFQMVDNNKTKVQFPIIEGNRVYLVTHGKGADGEAAGKIYALDLETGAKQWEAPLGAGADHPPVILGDRIIVGGGPWVQAFQVTDGKPLWKSYLGPTKWATMGMESGGLYCFATDNFVMALDLIKGDIQWHVEVGTNATGDDKRVFSIHWGRFGGASLVALDPASGRSIWERKGVSALPWVQDGKAFVVESGAIRCLDVMDGKQIWEAPVPKYPAWPPMVMGQWLFVACPEGKTTNLRALDPATGKEAWSVVANARPGDGLLTADRSGILFPGKDNEMVCLK
jgi:outer membrane protein assembly factor BamB